MEPHAEITGYSLKDAWSHLAVMVVIAVVFIASIVSGLSLGIGSFSAPGPGLWPVLAASGGLFVTVVFTVMILMRSTPIIITNLVFDDMSWLRVAAFVFSVIGFLLLYPILGFLLSAIPTAFVLLRYASRAPLVTSLVTMVVAPVVLYVIFSELLSVRI